MDCEFSSFDYSKDIFNISNVQLEIIGGKSISKNLDDLNHTQYRTVRNYF